MTFAFFATRSGVIIIIIIIIFFFFFFFHLQCYDEMYSRSETNI